MIVILDTNIINLLTYPKDDSNYENTDLKESHKEVYECCRWLEKLLSKGALVVVPEICDYEARRAFLLINSPSIPLLNSLKESLDFLATEFYILEKAAMLWAEARKLNRANTDVKNIDVDIIVCAHWCILSDAFPGRKVVIATKNVKDFEVCTQGNCDNWKNIKYL